MKLATIFGFARARVRYLALALPLFALFSTIQAGCSNTVNGGYYGATSSSSSSGSSGGPKLPPCTPYAYSECDDIGGYGTR